MPFISTSSGGNKVVPFYGAGGVPNPANVKILTSAPSTANVDSPLGTIAINTTTHIAYICVTNTGTTVTWDQLGLPTGTVGSLTGDSGGAIVPNAGNISLLGTANQIATTGTANTITWSLPAAITAPGSIVATTSLAATTTVTAGTGIIATTGNITATTGNLVTSAVAAGLVTVPTTTSGAAGTVVCNGRIGSCTHTGPSIASNADETFIITNSSVTGTGTKVLVGWHGATTGSALSMKSLAMSASTITIVMTNGDGAAIITSVADITFDFIVLN